MPARVSTAVSEAGYVADEDLVRSDSVPVRASAGWSRDPLAVRGLHQLAQHSLVTYDRPGVNWRMLPIFRR
jgi:hypothetical protein